MTENAPGVFAKKLGIVPKGKRGYGLSSSHLTMDQVLDLAVAAYWRNRPKHRSDAA